MARINTHLGSRRRTRLSLRPDNIVLDLYQGAAPHPAPASHASGSAHYHGDLTIPGYHPKTPTRAPAPGQAATHPAGNYPGAARAYTRSVAALPIPAQLATLSAATSPSLSPSTARSLGSTLEQLLSPPSVASALEALLGKKEPAEGHGTLADGDWAFTKDQLHPDEKLVGEHEGKGVSPFTELMTKRETVRPGDPPHIAAQKRRINQTISQINAIDDRGRAAWVAAHQPPVRPSAARAPAADPRDPLGTKTLGDVTAAQLAAAQQAGTLKVSQRGVLTTPGPRQALQHLATARHRFTQTNGITGPLTDAQKQIAMQISRETGLLPKTVATQELQEESGSAATQREAEGNYNVLNIGYTDAGPLGLTGGSEWGNPRSAAKATTDFFQGEKYSPSPAIAAILGQAKGKSAAEQLQIIGNSGWASSNYATDLAATSQSVGERHDPQAAKALVVAKQNARAVGINPTPFNGDVAPGGDKMVWIRAGADGMVDWAKSALGTLEGTPKQLHWAAAQGLGSSQPWCANFISNGLKRRGVELPPNPNYVPSYETEWKGGVNIGTDLSKAKPGDLVAFSGQHIGLYIGNGEMISGNFGDKVSRDPISADSSAVSMILRPHYKGGKVRVPAGTPLSGSTSESAFSSATGGGEVSGSAGGSGGAATQRPSIELTPLQAPLAAGPTLPADYLGGAVGAEDPYASSAADNLVTLLGEEPVGGRRPSL